MYVGHYLSGLGLKAEEKKWMGKCENVIAFFPGKAQLEQNFAVLTWEEHFEIMSLAGHAQPRR